MKRHEEAENSGIPEDQLPQDIDVGLMERAKYVRADRNEQKTVFDCDECDKSFNKFCLLTEHKRSKHRNGYPCRICHRSFASRKVSFGLKSALNMNDVVMNKSFF